MNESSINQSSVVHKSVLQKNRATILMYSFSFTKILYFDGSGENVVILQLSSTCTCTLYSIIIFYFCMQYLYVPYVNCSLSLRIRMNDSNNQSINQTSISIHFFPSFILPSTPSFDRDRPIVCYRRPGRRFCTWIFGLGPLESSRAAIP